MTDGLHLPERARLALLMCLHVVVCCMSLVFITRSGNLFGFSPPKFHIFYEPTRLHIAVAVVTTFSLASLVFVVAPFSFGYFAGFYLYTMILGFLWLNCFSDLNYDHRLAGFSAAASACAFLMPAVLMSSPTRQRFALSTQSFDRLLKLILLLSIAAVAIGSIHNFQIVSLANIYHFRETMAAPFAVNYLVTIVSNALLPFAFAGFVVRKAPWWAAAAIVLLCFFYPITLNKLALLTPPWLIIMLVLSTLFEIRTAVIISMLGPILLGLSLLLLQVPVDFFFYTINFRLVAIPSIAMEVYNHFFSRHELTYYCQVWVLKTIIMHCPYQEPLSVLMEREYDLGTYNASLFATEGIASVGVLFAPVAAFACGLVIAIGNRWSAGLPARFILISGAVLPQVLLNVPLSTVMLTHGGALLFLLWYITPRTAFEETSFQQGPV